MAYTYDHGEVVLRRRGRVVSHQTEMLFKMGKNELSTEVNGQSDSVTLWMDDDDGGHAALLLNFRQVRAVLAQL